MVKWVRGLASALEYMHSIGIIHYDLKGTMIATSYLLVIQYLWNCHLYIAGNILLDKSYENAYIGDFGTAKECSDCVFENGKWSDFSDLISLVYRLAALPENPTRADHSIRLDPRLKSLVKYLEFRAGPAF